MIKIKVQKIGCVVKYSVVKGSPDLPGLTSVWTYCSIQLYKKTTPYGRKSAMGFPENVYF